MASKKIKDLAVKTGSYTDRDGREKSRYENVGSLMQMDDGSQFILLKRTFNPAGVPVQDGKDQIIVSVFDLRDDSRQDAPAQAQAPAQSAPAAGQDVPF